MHTLTVEVQDSVFQEFLSFISKRKESIEIKKDKNLEYDPYFYERKKDLEQIIEESENGTMELLSQEQYDQEMNIFFKDLKANENI